MKAMILAAGRGERLKPLTDTTPKPLLKIGEHSLIEYHLFKLAKLGLQDVVINVSHLNEAIMAALGDGQRYGLKIQYSIEVPGPLETGGGIFQALQNGLLDEKPFMLISGDVWTEYPLGTLPHDLKDDAFLVMVDNPSYRPQGDFGLMNTRITMQPPFLTYASLGVLNPRLFANCSPGYFKLAPLLLNAIRADRVSGVHYKGAWFNIGTVNDLEELRKYQGASHEKS